MAIHEPVVAPKTQQTCFLCALDPYPCSVLQLEGLISTVGEIQQEGEAIPWIMLKLSETYALIKLNRYYHALVKALRALGGPLEKYHLTLRVYHLPPATNTTVHNERT